MKRTSFTKTLLLPMAAAVAVGLSACGGGGGGQPGPTTSPPPDPAPTAPPLPNPGTDPAPPAPEAVRLPVRTMDPGAVVTLVGIGRLDAGGGALSCRWRQTAGTPRVTLRGADTCRPEFDAPNPREDAVLAFTLTATDAAGAVRAVVVETIAVRGQPPPSSPPPGAQPPPGAPAPPRNLPPTANAGSDFAAAEGYAAVLDGSASSDTEGGRLTYAWAQTGGTPQVTLSGASTSAPTFAAPNLQANAELTFRLTVTDPGGLSATDSVTVTVTADNDTPTANAGSDFAAAEGYTATLDGSASSDPESRALTYAWAQTGGMPSVTLSGASTSAPTFAAPNLQANAELTFRLTVTDPGGLSATDSVTVTVTADADAPTANAGSDFAAAEGYTATLDGSASSDPEGGTLTYAWAQTGGTPQVTLSGASTSAPTFTAPQVTGDTALTFTLTATDPGSLSATDSVTVTVRNNAAPTANAGSGFAAAEGYTVTLDGSASSDPESGTLTYAWAQIGGTPQVTLSGASTSAPTFTAPQVTSLRLFTFRLTVTDPGGLSATDNVSVRVRDNAAPTARAGSDFAAAEGYTATLDGSASSDPESGALTYAWAQTGGTPQATLNGASTSAPTFTAPQVTGSAALTFTLTATDPGGLSATDAVTITVNDNAAPTARAGSDFAATEGYPATLDGSASSDPESGTLTYAWAQTAGTPQATLSGASTSAPTFTAPQVTGDTALTFTLTATDPGGLSATDTVTVTVNDNAAPTADAGDDFTTGEGYPATLDGSASSDPENGTLTYAWAQTAGTPQVTLSGASTSAPTFTAPQVTGDTALTFTLTATDPGGLSATDSVTVTLANVRPPTNTVRTPASGETLEPAAAKSAASSWKTTEYTRSNGLGLIRAAEGYAARTTGEPGGGGVTVAVFDTRIPPHPDLERVKKSVHFGLKCGFVRFIKGLRGRA